MQPQPKTTSWFEPEATARMLNFGWFLYGWMEREYLLSLLAWTQPGQRWVPPPVPAASPRH